MLTTFKCKFFTVYEQVDDLYYPYHYVLFYQFEWELPVQTIFNSMLKIDRIDRYRDR